MRLKTTAQFLFFIQIINLTIHSTLPLAKADVSPSPSTTPSISPSSISPNPSPSVWGTSGCDTACQMYKAGVDQAIPAACGSPQPTVSSSPIPIENNGTIYKSYSDCETAIKTKLSNASGQLGLYCDAIDLIKDTQSLQTGATIAYWAAFATCTASCVATFMSAGLAAVGAEAACTAADLSGTIIDAVAETQLTTSGEKAADLIASTKGFEDASTTLGTIGVVAAGGQTANLAGKILTNKEHKNAKVAEKFAKNVAENTENPAEAEAFDKMAKHHAKNAEKAAGKSVSEGSSKILSCATAALMGTIATIKTIQTFQVLPEVLKNECNNHIAGLQSIGNYSLILPSPTLTINQPPPPEGGGTPGPPNSGNLSSPGNSPPKPSPSSSTGPSTSEHYAATAANDPIAKGMQNGLQKLIAPQMQNLQPLKNALSQGVSPINAIPDSFPGFPAEGTALLQKLDDLAKQGLLHVDGLSGSIPSGGGKTPSGSGESKPNFMEFMSRLNKPAAQKTNETEFKKQDIKKLELGMDIWHPDWKGSIFQLASTRIDISLDKVEKLEWSTPLNRALLGLPKLLNLPVKKIEK